MTKQSGARALGCAALLAWSMTTATLVWAAPVAADKPAAPANPAAAAKPAASRLDELLARFAKAPGIFARFREEKHLAILDTPLVNEGTIHFAPPARLARHTEKPLASTLLIDGGQLKFGDAEGHQSMDLGSNPVARAFVDSFLLLLAGDRAGLDRSFTMRFEPEAATKATTTSKGKPKDKGKSPSAPSSSSWKLTLLPKVSPMDKLLANLVLRGHELVLEEMEIRETGGDWSRTVFHDVDVNHAYAPAEQARVFRIPTR